MKYIIKPAPFVVGTAPFKLEDFVAYLVQSDRRFNESGPGIRAGIRIEDACERCKSLSYVGPLQDEHHALLREVAEEPSQGYPRLVGMRADGKPLEQYLGGRDVLSFIDAIGSATSEPPANEISALAETNN